MCLRVCVCVCVCGRVRAHVVQPRGVEATDGSGAYKDDVHGSTPIDTKAEG